MNKSRIIRLSWRRRVHALLLSYTLQHTPPNVTGLEEAAWKGLAEETNTLPLTRSISASFPGERFPPRQDPASPASSEDREAAAGWGPAQLAAHLEPGRGLRVGPARRLRPGQRLPAWPRAGTGWLMI